MNILTLDLDVRPMQSQVEPIYAIVNGRNGGTIHMRYTNDAELEVHQKSRACHQKLASGKKLLCSSKNTPWIEISFTTYTQRFYLEPFFENYYAYCGYPTPDPVSWWYFGTSVKNKLYIEEQQRLESQKSKNNKMAGIPGGCPIHINFKGVPHSEASNLVAAPAMLPLSKDQMQDAFNIPGLRDVAVREYSVWHETNVADDNLKAQFRQARDVGTNFCISV